MCLGVPGRIVALDAEESWLGTVDFDGVRRPVCLAYTPEAQPGDYVIVHVGFAISRVDEEEHEPTSRSKDRLSCLNTEDGTGDDQSLIPAMAYAGW